jgi:hypothetical protein
MVAVVFHRMRQSILAPADPSTADQRNSASRNRPPGEGRTAEKTITSMPTRSLTVLVKEQAVPGQGEVGRGVGGDGSRT